MKHDVEWVVWVEMGESAVAKIRRQVGCHAHAASLQISGSLKCHTAQPQHWSSSSRETATFAPSPPHPVATALFRSSSPTKVHIDLIELAFPEICHLPTSTLPTSSKYRHDVDSQGRPQEDPRGNNQCIRVAQRRQRTVASCIIQ